MYIYIYICISIYIYIYILSPAFPSKGDGPATNRPDHNTRRRSTRNINIEHNTGSGWDFCNVVVLILTPRNKTANTSSIK